MRTFTLLSISALLAMALWPIIVDGNEKAKVSKYLTQEYTTSVRLEISASEEIENQIYSYFSRELRSLGDVELVEDNPEWIIHIVALQAKDRTGYSGGVIFSVVIEKVYEIHVKDLLLVVRGIFKINDDDWKELKEKRQSLEKLFTVIITDNNVRDNIRDLVHHSLRTDKIENTHSLCKEIVADFDAELLKKERDTWRRLSELLSSCKVKDNKENFK